MTKKVIKVLEGTCYKDPPIWLMRQAGRYLPEYKKLRASAKDLRSFFLSPEMAKIATLQPLQRYELDAAIVFSDILILPHAMGRALDYNEKTGPQMPPLTSEDLLNLPDEPHAPTLETAAETIAITKPDLESHITMIGFAGSPFTVACYMIDGGHVQGFPQMLFWLSHERENLQSLIDILTEHTITLLKTQIQAGAEVIQIFDSWASVISQTNQQEIFDAFILKPTLRICEELKKAHPDIKIIGFPRLVGDYIYSYIDTCPVDGVSLDETINPLQLRSRLATPYKNIPLQGNIAANHLLAGAKQLQDACRELHRQIQGTPHIINLGHGVLKSTPPEHVQQLIAAFRS